MSLNKNLFSDCKLYIILDREVQPYSRLFDIAGQALKSGVDLIQLRDKHGKAIEILREAERFQKLADDHKALFVINDRPDIAMCLDSAHVHVGQEDIPVSAVKRFLPKGRGVGTSCQTIDHIREAEFAGADYVGFGSVFETQTKPRRSPMNLATLREAAHLTKIPLFAIGGLTEQNLPDILACGVTRIALCREICLSDDIPEKVRSIRKILDNS